MTRWVLLAHLGAAVLLLAHSASASMIVGVQGADVLAIAGDSISVVTRHGGGGRTVRRDHCKVHVVAAAIVGMSGTERMGRWKSGQDDTVSLDARPVVLEIVRQRRSIRSAAQEIADKLRQPMTAVVRRLRTHRGSRFAPEVVKDGTPVLGVLIGGFEQGEAVMAQISLKATAASGLVIDQPEVPPPFPPSSDEARLFRFGYFDDDDLLSANPYVPPTPLEFYARALVDWTIRRHPQDVVHPVDVVRLDRRGHLWISRKPNCLDTE